MKIQQLITERQEIKALDKYFQEISKEKGNPLSSEEEKDLSRRYQENGDRAALNKLIEANLRFVMSVAKQHQNQGLPLMDLVSEGNIGLIKAAEMFDETKGFKFISYAVWWIRQSILKAIGEQSRVVRLPLNRVGNITKINKALSRLEQTLERPPTIEEIADEVGFTEDEIIYSMQISDKHISIDAPFEGDDEEGSLLDVLCHDYQKDELSVNSLKKEINRVLGSLKQKEADVLQLFFGINGPKWSIDEIAEKFNITKEGCRVMKERAIKKARKNSDFLRKYLE